ncbi:MAG: bifunctional glutamate N-acetyltransferase/amino-acid acetyltransferase ArgJ [Actinomycetota bacterium]
MAAGVEAGIKRAGGLDLALVVSESAAAAAGVFTTNLAAAAPVHLSRERVASGSARAIVINSGCANACTGRHGVEDARSTVRIASAALGLDESEVLVCSTGLIGSLLPMDKMAAGIEAAAAALGRSDEAAARAIMTTDSRPKRTAISSGSGWTIGGMAKGAGMIAPNMATMLAVITTDAVVEAQLLQSILSNVAGATFNRISVDGDTSTNDSVLVLANGASGQSADPEEFSGYMYEVCSTLARMIVADGEGATKFVTVRVSGAEDYSQADAAARTVAQSLLVKTAVYGGDANWGRIAAALGRCGARFDLDRLTIEMGGEVLFENGEPAPEASQASAREAMVDREISIHCHLGAGDSEAAMLTTDLGPGYVSLNAEYET